MSVAKNIRRFREQRGFSVRGLARASGVSQPYLRLIEKDERKNPSGEILQKLATTLGVTVADLLGSPLEVSGTAMQGLSPSLKDFVARRKKALGLRQEDVEMLKQLHYRGKQPNTIEDWELVYLFIKRILK